MIYYGTITIPEDFWERSFSSPPSHARIVVNDTAIALVSASPEKTKEEEAA